MLKPGKELTCFTFCQPTCPTHVVQSEIKATNNNAKSSVTRQNYIFAISKHISNIYKSTTSVLPKKTAGNVCVRSNTKTQVN